MTTPTWEEEFEHNWDSPAWTQKMFGIDYIPAQRIASELKDFTSRIEQEAEERGAKKVVEAYQGDRIEKLIQEARDDEREEVLRVIQKKIDSTQEYAGKSAKVTLYEEGYRKALSGLAATLETRTGSKSEGV